MPILVHPNPNTLRKPLVFYPQPILVLDIWANAYESARSSLDCGSLGHHSPFHDVERREPFRGPCDSQVKNRIEKESIHTSCLPPSGGLGSDRAHAFQSIPFCAAFNLGFSNPSILITHVTVEFVL
jgi:hypothetical protein